MLMLFLGQNVCLAGGVRPYSVSALPSTSCCEDIVSDRVSGAR